MTDIYVTKPFLPPMEEYIELLKPLWNSHYLTNFGTIHDRLEKEVADFLQTPNFLAFSNGHIALEAVLRGNGISGEVITTPFSFASTTHAITRCGLTPVFADIRPDDYTIDPDRIEALITEKTSAILAVHVYGNVCQVKKIEAIANKYGLKVIYDAAHAFGVTYEGKGIGNYGDASVFSFHSTKLFHSVEGGGIAFGSKDMLSEYHKERNFGIMGADLIQQNGGNGKMSEFHAAMGLCNLKHYDEVHLGRKRVVETYRKCLDGVPGIKMIKPQEGVEENYAYFPILIDEEAFGENRDQLVTRLATKGIHARKYFYPLIPHYDCYKEKYKNERFPVAEYISDRIMTIPLYDSLSEQDMDYICNVILHRR